MYTDSVREWLKNNCPHFDKHEEADLYKLNYEDQIIFTCAGCNYTNLPNGATRSDVKGSSCRLWRDRNNVFN